MKRWMLLAAFALLLIAPQIAYSMHIMEGFLPLKWCIIWDIASLPFVVIGLIAINKKVKESKA
jgi:hypothetical protein